jgi:hypothetical protein
LIFLFRDDLWVQGRSEDQRDLLDVESVAGHLLKPGSVFGFLARQRRQLFPDEMFADLYRLAGAARRSGAWCVAMC